MGFRTGFRHSPDSEAQIALPREVKLCAQRKGKVKLNLFYKGKEHEAHISYVKVQLAAAKRDVYLVLVYGITEHPMMLVTNKAISGKEDVIKIARLYFSRWRIEEYFRAKKQIFDFENFRVRKLKAINALNFYIGIAMAFLAHMTRKDEANTLLKSVLEAARPIKDKVQFLYYRIADGITELLRYAQKASENGSSPKGRTNTSCVFDYRPDVHGYIPPRRNCLGRLRLAVMPFFAIWGAKHTISCRMGVSPLRNPVHFDIQRNSSLFSLNFGISLQSYPQLKNPPNRKRE